MHGQAHIEQLVIVGFIYNSLFTPEEPESEDSSE